MLTVTIQIRAEHWGAARLAMRQAYQRNLGAPLRPGKDGHYQYELRVIDQQQDEQPFTFTENT